MRLTAQEEYGLRCLLRLAYQGDGASLTIPEISRLEGLSVAYVAKLMRILRKGGLVMSERGVSGGYALARPSNKVIVGEALAALGGRLYDPRFCDEHSGADDVCTHSTNCSVRSLWRMVQTAVDEVLSRLTLRELMMTEQQMTEHSLTLINLSSGSPTRVTAPSEPAH